MEDLLTDERTTLGDVNRSSLTFRIEEIDASSTVNANTNTNQAKGLQGENYVKWNKKTSTKLPIKNADFSFGMYHLSAISLMVLLPLIAYHLYEYIANYSDSNKMVNMVELFNLISETRNVHSIMRQALMSTIFWNNTEKILGKSAASTYSDFSNKMRDSIVFSYNAKKNLDYGSTFSPFFSRITSDYKVCDLLNKYGTGYARCGQGSLASMDTNFIMFLRSVTSLTDDMFISWQNLNKQPKLASELVRVPKFTNYLGITFNFSVVDDLYYILMKPLAESILTQLESDVSQGMSQSTVKYLNEESKMAVLHHLGDPDNTDNGPGLLLVGLQETYGSCVQFLAH